MRRNAEIRSPYPLIIVLGVVGLWILFRLFDLSVINASEYSAKALETRTVTIENTAKRGTIYDRNGIVLAASVDATTVYCNPSEVTNVGACQSAIVEALGGEKDDYTSALTKQNTTFAYIKRQADVDAATKLKEKVKENQEDLSGIYFLSDSRREYPNGSVGGQIIGICDVDGNGICGLELEYDEILKGTNGKYIAERSVSGEPIPGGVKEDSPSVEGQDIMITLDVSMQAEVENYLKNNLEQIGSKKGSSILMDSATGEIYAACSYPYLNPADTENSESGSDNVTCITSATEQGSMMKTVTALGLLQAGVITPSDTIYCPTSIQADEYSISDAYERGGQTMTFDEILTNSSNVGISLASERIGSEGVYNNILKSGISKTTGVDFPGEAKGYVSDVSTWSKIQSYNVTFGQGITTTPLELVRFYGAIANDSVATTPHFLMSKTQNAEYVSYDTEDLGYSESAISTISDMLKNVVNNNEGISCKIDGYDICGKTGTAEYSDGSGQYVKGRYNLGFTGFIDNASTKFVCYVGAMDVGIETNMTSTFGDIMKSAIERYKVVPNAN